MVSRYKDFLVRPEQRKIKEDLLIDQSGWEKNFGTNRMST